MKLWSAKLRWLFTFPYRKQRTHEKRILEPVVMKEERVRDASSKVCRDKERDQPREIEKRVQKNSVLTSSSVC